MRSTISAAVILGLAVALQASAGFADGALAVGMPGGEPKNGFRYKATADLSADEARSQAMAACRNSKYPKTGQACKVIESFRDQCVSVALNGDANTPSTAVGWAIAPDSKAADNRASNACELMRVKARGRACHLDGDSLCDGSAK